MKRTLRVTGGAYRGRRVRVPPGKIRPTMDRMRESLFSILGDLTDASFLDLFAGSGIMAVEACSRGAAKAVAVEGDRGKKQVLSENLEITGGAGRPIISSVEEFLRRNQDRFDVVYLDPPFDYRDKGELLARVESAGCLGETGILLIHHPGESLPEQIRTLRRTDRRRYGGSHVDFYRRATGR